MLLICGGAGYVGSHVSLELAQLGEDILILDNLSTGNINSVGGMKSINGDIRNGALLDEIFRNNSIDAVLHFACANNSEESEADPLKYYDNNVCGAVSLAKAMVGAGCKKLVFSSSASIYSHFSGKSIDEKVAISPQTTFAKTVYTCEQVFRQCDAAYGLKTISLRYFSAAGAHPSGELGEDHTKEEHLFPNIIKTALNQRELLKIYGNDFETKDGTCMRDYVHVCDIANAHVLSLDQLMDGANSNVYNLGTGIAYSILDCIKTVEKLTGLPVKYEFAPRRANDVAVRSTSYLKIARELGWLPISSTLENIVDTAFAWHAAHPTGFSAIVRE